MEITLPEKALLLWSLKIAEEETKMSPDMRDSEKAMQLVTIERIREKLNGPK